MSEHLPCVLRAFLLLSIFAPKHHYPPIGRVTLAIATRPISVAACETSQIARARLSTQVVLIVRWIILRVYFSHEQSQVSHCLVISIENGVCRRMQLPRESCVL
jgi:hypothetical protein